MVTAQLPRLRFVLFRRVWLAINRPGQFRRHHRRDDVLVLWKPMVVVLDGEPIATCLPQLDFQSQQFPEQKHPQMRMLLEIVFDARIVPSLKLALELIGQAVDFFLLVQRKVLVGGRPSIRSHSTEDCGPRL